MSEANQNPQMIYIKKNTDLPAGRIMSTDDLKISESAKKSLLIWDMSTEDRKSVWLLSVKSEYNSHMFLQVEKDIEKQGYRILKKGLIEISLLNQLYEKKSTTESQSSNSDDSVAILYFEKILKDAITEKVSDIHIEVRPNNGVIRMRKNGDMMQYDPEKSLLFKEANDLCSVIYNVLAKTKAVSFDPKDCQQAAVPYFIKDQELRLRYQSVPAYPDGYDVILRVLPIGGSETFTLLEDLGYTDQQVEDIVDITSRPEGSLIIAGVTGSGKSTTMKNLLMFINANASYRIKIYSIEDPPEYNIPRITQIPVVIGKDFDPTKMSPFEKPIKACMRGDPDIIMIGEVRDKITGDLTKKGIQSGHQVLTTVHATSGLGIIDRFQDFGLTPKVLGSPDFLTGLIYQKLMPISCKHCAIDFHELIESDKATEQDLKMYKKLSQVVPNIRNYSIKKKNSLSGNKCPHCKGSGIIGRTVCAEVIKIDINMLQFIEQEDTLGLMMYWRGLSDKKPESENMQGKTCMEHAFQKVLKGQVCPFSVEESFKPINEMLININEIKNKLNKVKPTKKIVSKDVTQEDIDDDYDNNEDENLDIEWQDI